MQWKLRACVNQENKIVVLVRENSRSVIKTAVQQKKSKKQIKILIQVLWAATNLFIFKLDDTAATKSHNYDTATILEADMRESPVKTIIHHLINQLYNKSEKKPHWQKMKQVGNMKAGQLQNLL